MAAAVSSPWGKPSSSWALEAEEHEAELMQQEKDEQQAPNLAAQPLADFPSLAAAASTKPKKKKGQTLSLAEFTAKPAEPMRFSHEEIVLPTGPRQRNEEELDRSRLGGGFKSYGMSRYGSRGDDSSSNDGRWGSSRVSNRESSREPLPPSRADEIDNWAAAKKSSVTNGFDRRERGDKIGFFDSQSSKADEVDSWVSKKTISEPPRRPGPGFERRISFESLQTRDSPRDLDNWGRKREEVPSGGGARPKLLLQPRTLPVTEDAKKEAAVTKQKGANPFGQARPREEVLAEKGQNWREIEEKLEAVKIKETLGAEKTEKGKSSFGLGNVPAPADRSWRKTESADGYPRAERFVLT